MTTRDTNRAKAARKARAKAAADAILARYAVVELPQPDSIDYGRPTWIFNPVADIGGKVRIDPHFEFPIIVTSGQFHDPDTARALAAALLAAANRVEAEQ